MNDANFFSSSAAASTTTQTGLRGRGPGERPSLTPAAIPRSLAVGRIMIAICGSLRWVIGNIQGSLSHGKAWTKCCH